MSLPKIQLPSEEVLLSDKKSKVRVSGLTRKQVMEIVQGMNEDKIDIPVVEVAYLTHGTGLPEEEVKEWYANAPAGDVQSLVNAVMRLSGMDDQTPKD